MKATQLSLMIVTLLAAQQVRGSVQDTESMQSRSFNVFWSGHSLTASPIPDYVASLSEASGTSLSWNYHTNPTAGASIEARTRGRSPQADGWDGYRQGDNRSGSDMDVIRELRTAESVGGGPYDALVITELNDLMWALLGLDSIRLLRHYHERFIDGNPDGQTHFYQAWLSVDDARNPRNWIAHERAAAPVWQCLATRVNVSLAAEGRSDRLEFLPAGLALAELVEKAISLEGLAGISGDSNKDTLNGLMPDNVHLTPLGSYYIALVSYAFLQPGVPQPDWHPPGVSPEQAASLQQVATEFVQTFRVSNQPLELPACLAYMRDGFVTQYSRYLKSTRDYSDLPWYAALRERAIDMWRQLRHTRRLQQAFSEDGDNPLSFDPARDREWWHPAP